MENAQLVEWVLQTLGGALLLVVTSILGFVAKEVVNLKSRVSSIETRVETQNIETVRRLEQLADIIRALDSKVDRLLEKKKA